MRDHDPAERAAGGGSESRKPALLYDPKSRGAESYIQLAKEIIGHSLPVEMPAPVEGEEKQVVNAPRWKRWIKERNKLTTINILDR